MQTIRRVLAMMAMTTAMAGSVQASVVPEKDAAEIQAALQGMKEAWNRHDMKAFVSYMADDVEWVNVVGMWWKGKAQVFKAHDTLHKTMFRERSLHDATDVQLRSIAPDVVVVTSIVPADGYTTPDGRKVAPDRNVLTEVFVRREGRWLIVQGQNTTADEMAVRHDPGK